MGKNNKVEQEQFQEVQYRMSEGESFDYCFNGYSDWKEIKDEKFHKLRQEYLKAAKELEAYVNQKADGL
jgi:hypothetical protein